MAKRFKMPTGGLDLGGQAGRNPNGQTAVADPPGEGQVESPVAVADQAAAMLESDDDGLEDGEAGNTFDGDTPTQEKMPVEAVHDLYKQGDEWIPPALLNDNGEIVLGMCKICQKAEAELDEPCVPREPALVDAAQPEVAAEAPAEPVVITITTEAPSQPIDVLPDTPEQRAATEARIARWRVRREWEDNTAAAKEKFVACALAHAELKAATKAAKADEEDAMEKYAALLKQNPDYNPYSSPVNTRSIADQADDDDVADSPKLSEEESQEMLSTLRSRPDVTTTLVDGAAPNWESQPITVLNSLTPKLIEKLQESGLTTMGKLEARRAEIALSNGGEKWPKGIGEVKITAIEDAIIDWLTENRDKAVFAELASGASSEPAEEETSEAAAPDSQGGVSPPAAEPIADPPYVEGATTIRPDVTAEEFTAAINNRALELDNGEPDALDDKLNAGYWTRGYEHYEAGGELRTCGLPPCPGQDDFIRGWLAAGKAAEYGKREEQTKPAAASNHNLVDMSDL